MSINTTAAINARFAAINFTYEANTDGYLITNLSTGKTKQFDTFFLADIISGLEQVIENRKEQVAYEAEQARLAVMAEKQVEYGIALPQGEPVAEAEAEAEVVETVATIETANLTNYDIVTLAENNGFRVSLQETGEWLLIRKSDRQVTNIGYNLKDAVAIINPAPETFAQVEIERGYAAQEAEEHAAWVAEQQQEEEVMTEDDDTMKNETEQENPWFRVPNYMNPTEEDQEEWEARDAALTEEYFQYMDWKYNKEKEKE